MYSGTTSDTLYILQYICPANTENVENYVRITRYFGAGTFNFLLFLVVIFVKTHKNVSYKYMIDDTKNNTSNLDSRRRTYS